MSFLWGVAIASHQNDGGAPASDWTAAEAAGRYPHASGEGTRFREHMEADLDRLAGELGGNALRLSIEWARVEPAEGAWDLAELAWLHRLFDAADARGITVIATLHHFTSPAWLGGWEDPAAAAKFARYAAFVAAEFKGRIPYYLTLNEPSNLILGAYAGGMMPPFRKGVLAAARAARTMHRAHALAYHAIHAADPAARVSLTEFNAVLPLGPLPVLLSPGRYLARVFRDLPMDFVSLHFYGDIPVADMRNFPTRPDKFDTRPDHFRQALVAAWRQFKLPILVGENGLATRNHAPRRDGWDAPRYLEAHIEAMRQAMAQGVPVIGYLWWTLTDNYEWGTYDTRFGLYRVECQAGDYARIPTPAVETFRRLGAILKA